MWTQKYYTLEETGTWQNVLACSLGPRVSRSISGQIPFDGPGDGAWSPLTSILNLLETPPGTKTSENLVTWTAHQVVFTLVMVSHLFWRRRQNLTLKPMVEFLTSDLYIPHIQLHTHLSTRLFCEENCPWYLTSQCECDVRLSCEICWCHHFCEGPQLAWGQPCDDTHTVGWPGHKMCNIAPTFFGTQWIFSFSHHGCTQLRVLCF